MFNRIEIQALLSLSLRYALVFFALFKFCPNLSWMLEGAFSGASDLTLVGSLLVLIMWWHACVIGRLQASAACVS